MLERMGKEENRQLLSRGVLSLSEVGEVIVGYMLVPNEY